MKADSRTVASNGVEIAAEAFGDPNDTPLLLVMGATASMLGWPDALLSALARRGLHAIRFDHRDTGKSTSVGLGEATYAAEDMVGDMMAVLDDYGIERAHFVGMSLGGYLSQMAALQHPRRVASLTLIGSEPLGWDGEPLPHISQAFLDHFTTMEKLDWKDRPSVLRFLLEIERLCAGSAVPFDASRAMAKLEAVADRSSNLASAFNHGTVDTVGDWTGRFREIGQPVLVIHGEEDSILPLPNGRALAAGIGGARLRVLDRVGHELPPAVVEPLAEEIATFVGAG